MLGDESVRKRVADGLDHTGWQEGSRCLTGTRQRYLDEILKWSTDFDMPSVCWLTGVAGSGKTSIAHEVAFRHHSANQIYSCFFFRRGDTTISASVIQLLAFRLSYHNAALRASISNAMEVLQDLRTTPSFLQQFKQFLAIPLDDFCAINADTHITLIVDALDECPSKIRGEITYAIQWGALFLPRNVKIFLTSRLQQDIAVHMQTFASKSVHIKIGLDQDDGDLRHFFEYQLMEIRRDAGLEEGWSDEALTSDVLALTSKACGLFQWGAVACALIKDHFDPHAVIQRILNLQSGNNALDTLYADSLHQAFPKADVDLELRLVYMKVLGAIISAKEPLEITTIAELVEVKIDVVERLLKNLGCVISLESEGNTQVAYISHPSFFDFITNNMRCLSSAFFVDYLQASQAMAAASLNTMMSQLKFNICGLKTSHIFNDAIPDLALHIKSAIPASLSYSCRFWAHHVQNTPFQVKLLEKVKNFLTTKFLYWLEVMSLLKETGVAQQALLIIVKWIEVGQATCFF
jgi:hypothetical protein